MSNVIPILAIRERCPVCGKLGPSPHGLIHPLLYHDLLDNLK